MMLSQYVTQRPMVNDEVMYTKESEALIFRKLLKVSTNVITDGPV